MHVSIKFAFHLARSTLRSCAHESVLRGSRLRVAVVKYVEDQGSETRPDEDIHYGRSRVTAVAFHMEGEILWKQAR